MELKDVLLLSGHVYGLTDFLATKGIKVRYTWKKDHFSKRKFSALKLFNLEYLLFGFNKKMVQKYNRIIVGESAKAASIISFIKKWNPYAEIKYVLWNMVDDDLLEDVKLIKDMHVEVYSFNEIDCEKYKLKYNFNLYPFQELAKDFNYGVDYDCYFCGMDKGRLQNLVKLKNFFNKNNISYKFRVKVQKNVIDKEIDTENIILMSKDIPYLDVIKEFKKASCIIELTQRGQSGFTWRVYESLYFNKKLITDNYMLKNCPFYHPDNILIIENFDDLSELDINRFLSVPYHEVDEKFKENYSYKQWINKFFK